MSRSSSRLTDRWKAFRGRRPSDLSATPPHDSAVYSCDRAAGDWRMTSVAPPHHTGRGRRLPYLYGHRRWRIFTPSITWNTQHSQWPSRVLALPTSDQKPTTSYYCHVTKHDCVLLLLLPHRRFNNNNIIVVIIFV